MNQLCPKCNLKQTIQTKILPCGYRICFNCAQIIYDRNSKVFQCELCNQFHDLPKSGFTTSTSSPQLQSTATPQSNSYITNLFNEIEQKTNEHKQYGHNKINEYFHGLKQETQKATELAMQAIQQSNQMILQQIEVFEKQKQKEFDDVFYNLKLQLDQNRSKCESSFNKNKDEQMIKALEICEQFKAKFSKSLIEQQIFNGVMLKFEKNPLILDQNLVGKVKLQKLLQIDFNHLNHRINLSNILTDLDKSSIEYSFKIETFDNGNIFIAHRMINKYFKYSIFNYKDRKLCAISLDEKFKELVSCYQNSNFIYIYSETEEYGTLKKLNENIQKTRVANYFKRLIGVNDSYVYCISTKLSNKPLYVFNLDLEPITSLGQRDSSKKPFYFPSNIKQIDNRNGRYVWLNDKTLNILDELNGNLINTYEKEVNNNNNNKEVMVDNKFVINSLNHIILMCRTSNKLIYLNLIDGCLLQQLDLVNFPLNGCIDFLLNKQNEKLMFFIRSTLELCEV